MISPRPSPPMIGPLPQTIRNLPFTSMTYLWIKRDDSEQRRRITSATSSNSPSRPSGPSSSLVRARPQMAYWL